MSTTLKIALASGILLALPLGCVSFKKPFAFESAPTPAGWPDRTPIGEVQVKEYPSYREAVAGGGDVEPVFRTLFNHIKKNDIAMTAPVDMSYDDRGEMASMAFLYRTKDLGPIGAREGVNVVDRQKQKFASVGVRGSYSAKNYREGLQQVESWLAKSKEWKAAGDARYLGYNGPFVPWFWRYGEVQIPVAPR